MKITNFKQAQDVFENSRKRKVGNNTYLVKTTKGYGIQLYNTIIVEYLDANRVRLNTGGWRTVTTHSRMNEFVSFNLYNLGFKRIADMPNNIVVDDRDLFIEYPKSEAL